MRGRSYAVLAVVSICLIFLNAAYGHLIYGSLHGQALNKYSVYVHLQPGWSSAPANILYDITVSWDGPPGIPGDVSPYNANSVDSQRGRQVVLLSHGFSDCEVPWSPPLYRYGADLLRGTMRHVAGEQLNVDPYVPLLPDIPNESYPDGIQSGLVADGYVQFVPVCTSREESSFRYAISMNNPHTAFDVHFVPSRQEMNSYLAGDGSFQEYVDCGALNRRSYSGSCVGVGPDSGLLVILPDNLDWSLTRIAISMQETTSSPGAESMPP